MTNTVVGMKLHFYNSVVVLVLMLFYLITNIINQCFSLNVMFICLSTLRILIRLLRSKHNEICKHNENKNKNVEMRSFSNVI